jgi:hypothetical protein
LITGYFLESAFAKARHHAVVNFLPQVMCANPQGISGQHQLGRQFLAIVDSGAFLFLEITNKKLPIRLR